MVNLILISGRRYQEIKSGESSQKGRLTPCSAPFIRQKQKNIIEKNIIATEKQKKLRRKNTNHQETDQKHSLKYQFAPQPHQIKRDRQ